MQPIPHAARVRSRAAALAAGLAVIAAGGYRR